MIRVKDPFLQELDNEMFSLLGQIKNGRMSNTAYDTAWIALLHAQDKELAEGALTWLRENQLPDGSWGAEKPLYYHDRVICTLAAMLALSETKLAEDRIRLELAHPTLRHYINKLSLDPVGETAAFELLFPTLLSIAYSKSLVSDNDFKFLEKMSIVKQNKLNGAPGKMISRLVTMAFSAEMVGPNNLQLIDEENLLESNGSVALSPSATAFFLRYIDPSNEQAWKYVHSIVNEGGAPDVAPFDVFEIAWTLWNLTLAWPIDLGNFQPLIHSLTNIWTDQGIGHDSHYSIKDGDDTGFVFQLLSRFGYQPSLNTVHQFETENHFRCFSLESNPSVSTNIHMLGALQSANLPLHNRSVQKCLAFLKQQQRDGAYWFDKWHVSPYYPTSHLIINALGYCDSFASHSVAYLLETQNVDGSWGYYHPSVEETAYCLQALALCQQHAFDIPTDSLIKGANWLRANLNEKYIPLWIGKCLYAPDLVIRSAAISALKLASQAI